MEAKSRSTAPDPPSVAAANGTAASAAAGDGPANGNPSSTAAGDVMDARPISAADDVIDARPIGGAAASDEADDDDEVSDGDGDGAPVAEVNTGPSSAMKSFIDRPGIKDLAKKLLTSRRSSIGRAKRQSRSLMGGISFEDQVGAIDEKAAISERLERLVTIAMSATCRAIQEEYRDSSNDATTDLVDDICMNLRAQPLLSSDTVLTSTLVEKIERMRCPPPSTQPVAVPVAVLPSRVREIRDYTQRLEAEKRRWKEMGNARKQAYLVARREKKDVRDGIVKVDDGQLACLTTAEDILLRGASDGRGELDRLVRQTTDLQVAKRHLSEVTNAAKRRNDQMEAELNRAAKAIIGRWDEKAWAAGWAAGDDAAATAATAKKTRIEKLFADDDGGDKQVDSGYICEVDELIAQIQD